MLFAYCMRYPALLIAHPYLQVAFPLVMVFPFILLAGSHYAYGDPDLYAWLREKGYFGESLTNWENGRSMSLRTKMWSMGCMLVSLWLSFSATKMYTSLLLSIILGSFIVYIARRPQPER